MATDEEPRAGAVADTAGQQAQRVADEVRGQARSLAEDARHQLHSQAREQTGKLGGAVGTLGEQVQALADGRPEDAGPVQDIAQRLGGQVRDLSARIEELGFDGSLEELRRFARRRPGMFLAGAAMAGFAASRLARGATQDDTSDRSATPSRPAAGTTSAPHGTAPPPVPVGAPRPAPTEAAPTSASASTGGRSPS